MLKITGGQVFTGEAFEEKTLFICDGRIAKDIADGADAEEIDAQGCYVIPGLVDVHSHGAVGYDFCDGTHEAINAICRYQASRGVTAYCPATMTYPEEKLAGIARCAAEHVDADDAAALVGINMEGPFISPNKVGAQNPAYVQCSDAGMFHRLQAAAGGLFKIVDIAPEEPGALDFVKEVHDEVRISIAHTTATYDQARAAFEAGAKHVTHLFNAMPPLAHREPGVIGAAADAKATPEIIADGVHIHPSAVRAAFKLFDDDHMIFVSDSMMATGLDDGEYSLGGQAVTVRGNRATLHDGTLAGSATDLMSCFQIAVRDMGIPLISAIKAASVNPARAIGLEQTRGNLNVGSVADVIVLDESLNLRTVVVRGKVLQGA